MTGLDLLLAGAALGAWVLALALRPWRLLPPSGPPWPWLLWASVLPLLWTSDRLVHAPLLQPLSGACLLALMAGWPLAVLGLLPITLAAAWLGELSALEALHRGVSLGLLPMSLALLLGAGVRRWMPPHLMVYILGRGFAATLLAGSVAGAAALALPHGPQGLSTDELMLARWLSAWADAVITGMLTAVCVAFRPQWLSTYSDRLYLPT